MSNKSSIKPMTTASTSSGTGNYDIYTDTKNTLPKNPPAYDYFNKESTVYAQIDHFKTLQHKSNSAATMPSTALPNSASASNAYQLHHQQPIGQPYQSTSPYQSQVQANLQLQCGSDTNYNTRISNNNSGSNGTLSNSNTLTFSSIQSPSSSNVFYNNATNTAQPQQSVATTTSKQYSREIVTIRTPLLCSQQESCV